MTKQLLFVIIKFLMVSAPFLSVVMMILALWGVVGKATYTDFAASKKGIASGANEAKNYLVNETKTIDQCPKETMSADRGPEGEKPMPDKIDWEHVV